MVSGSQALEKVWLFSVPLHPMLILWKHMFLEFQKHQARNIFQQYLTVCCALMYNLTLCKIHLHHYFA